MEQQWLEHSTPKLLVTPMLAENFGRIDFTWKMME
jgi:hypothetical protein